MEPKIPILSKTLKAMGHLVKTTTSWGWHKEILKARPPNNKNIGPTLSFSVQKNITKLSVTKFWPVSPLPLNVIYKAWASINFKLVQIIEFRTSSSPSPCNGWEYMQHKIPVDHWYHSYIMLTYLQKLNMNFTEVVSNLIPLTRSKSSDYSSHTSGNWYKL